MRWICLLMLFGFFSCIREITPPIRNVAPILVVDGWLTTDPGPYLIKLSYSGEFTAAYQVNQQHFIADAQVSITADNGDSTSCTWMKDGTYQSSDSNFLGVPGRSYVLHIRLSNGRNYVSRPEKIEPVAPIDSVTVFYDSTYITNVRPTQLIISTNTHDPAGAANYYRWSASGYIPRRSSGGPCSLGSPPCGIDCVCFAFCSQFLAEDQLNVLSDRFIDGKEIVQPVYYSPVYWNGTHFIEIKQYSISRTAFQFWKAYTEQTTRTGSIFDPLPAAINGNVYNAADSSDLALGLFSASMAVTKKVKIIPVPVQQYYLRSIAGVYIPDGDCHAVIANSLADDDDPDGWQNAQVIDMR